LYKIPANTLFIGKQLIYVPDCHSTNTLAQELSLQPSFQDGTVVITDNQTAGRGQRGNTWHTQPGMNLTLSIYLKPAFLLAKDQFFLNIFTSLAIHDLLLHKSNAIVKIKWPNDILASGKKLCGILIENQIRGLQVSSSIVGIGLNVNQIEFTVSTAGSLATVSSCTFDLQQLMEELLKCIEARYLQLREGKFDQLKAAYLPLLYWLEEDHVFESNDGSFNGRIKGIDEYGKLRVATAGIEKSFDIKEITYLN
jgi:BirA family transcriptional regulator, biotin operon repressor / biotin---[acetyl-CoA-carboxylase] ligase